MFYHYYGLVYFTSVQHSGNAPPMTLRFKGTIWRFFKYWFLPKTQWSFKIRERHLKHSKGSSRWTSPKERLWLNRSRESDISSEEILTIKRTGLSWAVHLPFNLLIEPHVITVNKMKINSRWKTKFIKWEMKKRTDTKYLKRSSKNLFWGLD